MENSKDRKNGQPDGLKEDKAAELLSIPIDELRILCDEGKFPRAKKWHTKYYIPEEDVINARSLSLLQKIKKFLGRLIAIGKKLNINAKITILFGVLGLCTWWIGQNGGISEVWAQYVYDKVKPANEEQTLIIITEFTMDDTVEYPGAESSIERQLSNTIANLNILNFKVDTSSRNFSLDDYAGVIKYAKNKNASVVIWGEITSEFAAINIYSKENEYDPHDIETIYETAALDDDYTETRFYKLNLPNEIGFITMYTMGIIYLDKSENDTALQYFEFAIDELPNEIYSTDLLNQYLITHDETILYTITEKVNETINSDDPLDHIDFATIAKAYYYIGMIKSFGNIGTGEIFPYFNVATVFSPNDLMIQNGVGIVYLNSMNYSDAEHEFQDSIRENPNNSKTYYYLGYLHYRQANYNEAIAYFEEFEQREPENLLNTNYFLSELYLLKGDINAALKYITLDISNNPEESDSYYTKSQILELLGKNKDALMNLNKAIKYSTDDLACRFLYCGPYSRDRVRLLIKLGYFDKAYFEVNRSLKDYPRDWELLILRSFLYAKNGKYQNAVDDLYIAWVCLPSQLFESKSMKTIAEIEDEDFLQALSMYSVQYPDDIYVQFVNHMIEVKKIQEEYVQQYSNVLIIENQTRKLSDINFSDGNDLSERVCFEISQINNTNNSLPMEIMQTEIDHLPEYSDAYLCRAEYFMEVGKFDQAKEDVIHALTIEHTTRGYFDLAWLYYQDDRFDLAKEEITKAIIISPNESHPYMLRGFLQLEDCEYEEAILSYDTGLLLDNLNLDTTLLFDYLSFDSYYGRGYCYYMLQHYENAIQDFTTALSFLDNLDFDIVKYRADSELLLRKYDEAFMDYGLLNSSFPDSKEDQLNLVIQEIEKDKDSATETLEELADYLEIHKTNENFIYYYYLFSIHAQLGNSTKAMEYYNIYKSNFEY